MSEFLAKWLETWAYYNDKIRIVLQPLADGFVTLLARAGLSVVINPVWITYFWIFMLPGVGVMRLVGAGVGMKNKFDRLFYVIFLSSYAVFAVLLAMIVGAFPVEADAL